MHPSISLIFSLPTIPIRLFFFLLILSSLNKQMFRVWSSEEKWNANHRLNSQQTILIKNDCDPNESDVEQKLKILLDEISFCTFVSVYSDRLCLLFGTFIH